MARPIPEPEVDPPPFDVLYRTWHVHVKAALERTGVQARDLDDAAQDVFCVVLRELPGYEPRGRLLGWLATIIAKVAATYRRKAKHVGLARETGEKEMDVAATAPSAEDAIVARDLLFHLIGAIRKREQRVAFVLYHVGGLTISEIAIVEGVPEKTVEGRLRLARRELDAIATRLCAGERRASGGAVVISLFSALQRPQGEGMNSPPAGSHIGGAARTIAFWSTALGLLVGVVLGAVLGVLWARHHTPAPPPIVQSTAAEVPAALPESPPSPSTAPAPAPSTVPAPMDSSSAKPRAMPDVEAEIALARKASDALASGDTATATAMLDEHARRFPTVHGDWREATRIQLLIRRGALDEARTRIDHFARSHPNDPRLDAFRKAVAAP